MGKVRSSNAPLSPGEHSIDRCQAVKQPDGSYVLRWRLRDHEGQVTTHRTKGRTVGETRAKARAIASDRLTRSQTTTWKMSSRLVEYLDAVSVPAVKAAALRPATIARYLVALEHLKTELTNDTIRSGTRFRRLEAVLQAIAQTHGSESARQCRTVFGKYVAQQLIRDELLTGNPISGASIDLGTHKASAKPQGGRSLSREDYRKVLTYLLALNPSEGLQRPSRGRWRLDDVVARRRNAIDLTLLQAATGLRVGEANALTWPQVSVGDDGGVTVTVTAEISKTHRGRTVPVLNPDVARRILDRRPADATGYVIGSPADRSKPWDPDNCRKTVAELYPQVAKATGVVLLETARSHVWRATLNSLLVNVPEVVRSAYFGHDPEVNRRSYTDVTAVGEMLTGTLIGTLTDRDPE